MIHEETRRNTNIFSILVSLGVSLWIENSATPTQPESGSFQRKADIARTQIAALASAKRQSPRRCQLAHACYIRIVAIQHSPTVRRQRRHQRALLARRALDRAERVEMRRAKAGHHGDTRRGTPSPPPAPAQADRA